MALVPLGFKTLHSMHGGKGLQDSDKPLTGSQIQRGMYIQAGSRDAGPDPNWVRGVYQYPSKSKAKEASSGEKQ